MRHKEGITRQENSPVKESRVARDRRKQRNRRTVENETERLTALNASIKAGKQQAPDPDPAPFVDIIGPSSFL